VPTLSHSLGAKILSTCSKKLCKQNQQCKYIKLQNSLDEFTKQQDREKQREQLQ
jgi:hypothetical protein